MDMNWTPKYDVGFIEHAYIVPLERIYGYIYMNASRKYIKHERLRYLYNKNNIKKEFQSIGFNVPELYLYTNDEITQEDLLKHKSFVAKPAHMSESDNVVINNTFGLNRLNESLNKSAQSGEPEMLIQCERGIIIEEFIDVVYELKIFVVWGSPLIVDLRVGNDESHRVDFIFRENEYLNWDREFDLIEKFAEKIKIDFFRIDFLYDGKKLYAGECAFMPSTILPDDIMNFIFDKWSKPYLKQLGIK